jgi:hypothetical protein
MNITKTKIVNLLDMKNSMKMNEKKRKTKMNVPAKLKTKMNMKKTIEATAKSNMKVSVNAKMMMNVRLQMRMRCCGCAGYFGDQIKAPKWTEPPLEDAPHDLSVA